MAVISNYLIADRCLPNVFRQPCSSIKVCFLALNLEHERERLEQKKTEGEEERKSNTDTLKGDIDFNPLSPIGCHNTMPGKPIF